MTLKSKLQAHIQDRIRTRLMDRLIASREGRAHILNMMSEAESTDEGAVFEALAGRVEDEALQQMIRKHAEDEQRHAVMFRDRVVANGGTPHPVPENLRLIERINAAMGNFFDGELSDDKGVMEAYVLLQVVEERAITQFRELESVFRKYDPESADVIAAIASDEDRHLKYCHAISKRYAPNAEILAETLQRFRTIEARAFTDNGRANIQYCVDNNLLAVGRLENRLWRRFVRSQRQAPAHYTPFAAAVAA